MTWKLTGGLLVVGVAAALTAWYALQNMPSPRTPSFLGVATNPAVDSRFTGTASCSGRACHGRLEPSGDGDGIQANEHTTWLTHDRHADAYRVLFNDQSRGIIHALQLSMPAHENKRCLACHINPALLDDDSSVARTERQAGVGCETCHGAARDWLGPHTAWAKPDQGHKREQLESHGMKWLAGPVERTKLCVDCHVGTEPGRDVDHDLIAAGHPRLEFELTAFLANMPAHWRERARAPRNNEARTWAAGQIVTARAALSLLRQRAAVQASDQPWPEFAEYDCFACHHDLRDSGWRRQADRLGKRIPGTLAWNDRYLTFLPELLEGDAKEAGRLRGDLARDMAATAPSKEVVKRRVDELIGQLDGALKAQAAGPPDQKEVRALIAAITKDPERALANWDAAAQTYLALEALRGALENNQADPALRRLGKLLAFPSATDSPAGFREAAKFDDDFRTALRRVHEAAGSAPGKPAAPKPKP